MSRWSKVGWSLAAVAFVALAVLLAVTYWRYRETPAASRPAPAVELPELIPPLRVVSAYLALLADPTAARALVAGERSQPCREFLERAGLDCSGTGDGFDLVFASGTDDEVRAAFGRLKPGGVAVRLLDVRGEAALDFRRQLEAQPGEVVRLWMPGEHDWLLVGAPDRPVELAAALELFAREELFDDLAEGECDALPGLFAAYVGTREETLPAFASSLAGEVRAEWFVTREIPPLSFFAVDGVDADIVRSMSEAIRTQQEVRRQFLAGNLMAAAGRHDEALSEYQRAALRNPHDPMLLERLVKLRANAETFLTMGRYAMAAECFETMLALRPADEPAAANLAVCLERLGKAELANEVRRHAEELRRSRK